MCIGKMKNLSKAFQPKMDCHITLRPCLFARKRPFLRFWRQKQANMPMRVFQPRLTCSKWHRYAAPAIVFVTTILFWWLVYEKIIIPVTDRHITPRVERALGDI